MPTTLFKLLTISTLSTILLSGCIVIDLNGCGLEKVKGSGNVVSETRQIPDFNRVKLEGQGKGVGKGKGDSSGEVGKGKGKVDGDTKSGS